MPSFLPLQLRAPPRGGICRNRIIPFCFPPPTSDSGRSVLFFFYSPWPRYSVMRTERSQVPFLRVFFSKQLSEERSSFLFPSLPLLELLPVPDLDGVSRLFPFRRSSRNVSLRLPAFSFIPDTLTISAIFRPPPFSTYRCEKFFSFLSFPDSAPSKERTALRSA